MPKGLRHSESFKKSDRLYLRNQVQRLFEEGKSFKVFPFRVVFFIQSKNNSESEAPLPQGAEMLISVAKHRFEKAIDRNRIKRLIRESFRRHEGRKILLERISFKSLNLSFAIIVQIQALPSFSKVDEAMGKILLRLQKEVKKYNPKELRDHHEKSIL